MPCLGGSCQLSGTGRMCVELPSSHRYASLNPMALTCAIIATAISPMMVLELSSRYLSSHDKLISKTLGMWSCRTACVITWLVSRYESLFALTERLVSLIVFIMRTSWDLRKGHVTLDNISYLWCFGSRLNAPTFGFWHGRKILLKWQILRQLLIANTLMRTFCSDLQLNFHK